MEKGQIARQWCTLARSGAHWRAVVCGGVIGTIKCKKVKLLGSGAQWRAVVHTARSGVRN